jgi:uncharacterized protein (TIGR02996 family)
MREALLQEIIDNPADDAARLIYADWLEENGDVDDQRRAEFIRAQMRLDGEECNECFLIRQGGQRTNGGCRCSDEIRKLRWRERELIRTTPRTGEFVAYGYHWSEPLYRLELENGHNWEKAFRRGFLSLIWMPMQRWIDHGRAIVQEQPIERVEISDKDLISSLRTQFCWMLAGSQEHSVSTGALPREIFCRLRAGKRFVDREDIRSGNYGSPLVDSIYRGEYRVYVADAEARADLSQACIAWARTPEEMGQAIYQAQRDTTFRAEMT